jgi:hypothetical protein
LNLVGLPTITTGPNAGHKLNCPNDKPNCDLFSNPDLFNNVIWQNRSYYVGVGALSAAYQNKIVLLYNSFGTTQAPNQPQTDAVTGNGAGSIITGGTGACTAASYWDIGVRGDTGPSNHGSGFTLAPRYSVITDAADYAAPGSHNTGSNPTVAGQYCNGSRTPPELALLGGGWQVPPGIADATVPNPPFTLLPSATVDEGNNWVNMSWGPLTLSQPVTSTATSSVPLGNYTPTASSSTIDYVPSSAGTPYNQAPTTDFFGNARKTDNAVDAGAVEFLGAAGATNVTLTAATTATFPATAVPVTTAAAPTLDFLLHNNGPGTFTITGITAGAVPFTRVNAGVTGNCGAALANGATCTIRVRFRPTAPGVFNGTVTAAGSGPGGTAVTVTGSPLAITGTGLEGGITFSLNPTGTSTGVTLTGNALNYGAHTGSAKTAVLTLTNSGTASFNFTATPPGNTVTNTGGGARFAKGTDTCTGALAVNASCSITVTFTQTPTTSTTARNGTLTVRDNAAGANQAVTLAGN